MNIIHLSTKKWKIYIEFSNFIQSLRLNILWIDILIKTNEKKLAHNISFYVQQLL